MIAATGRSRLLGRVLETRSLRPELWLGATLLVGMLLVEVWQNSRVTQLCLELDRTRGSLVEANARLDFVRADFERRTTRAELAPLASGLGLAPARGEQTVTLPAQYLAMDRPETGARTPSLLAWAERASRAIVPEATARSRGGN